MSYIEIFPNDVFAELKRARELHAPIRCRHEALGVILEEFEEFKAEVFLKNPDSAKLYKELVHIAAMCWRSADDLGLTEVAQ